MSDTDSTQTHETFEMVSEDEQDRAVIRVIGLGGGGGNAITHMANIGIDGATLVAANTDLQDLNAVPSGVFKLQLGKDLTRGLGAGADPKVGRQAAVEDTPSIAEALRGTDMVFIVAGMGGGTGTGAAPVVAQIAQQLNITSVAVVTKPFSYEHKARMRVADDGIRTLRHHVNSLITIPNDKLLDEYGESASFLDGFAEADRVMADAVRSIVDLIMDVGKVNVDFADVKTVMSQNGRAMMGTATASGPERAAMAVEGAIRSPLLEDVNLFGAGAALVNITCDKSLTQGEYQTVSRAIDSFISDDGVVIIGVVIDPNLEDEMRVTVVVTGIKDEDQSLSIESNDVPWQERSTVIESDANRSRGSQSLDDAEWLSPEQINEFVSRNAD